MKSLLSRCAWWRTIGLVIDDRQIALSVMATTPRGRREIFSEVHTLEDQLSGGELERVLEPWISRVRGKRSGVKPWVQVAISESQVFQAMVPITSSNRAAPPQTFFLEAVGATNLRAEDRTIDLLKLELNKQPLACLAACPRNTVTSLIEMLDGLGARVAMIEPAPTALFRAGAFHKGAPRGSKLCVRFFLGQEQAIGLLAMGEQPLLWHSFKLTEGNETAQIMATYSTLWMQARHTRINSQIDTVVVHGRPAMALKLEPAEFQKRTGARLIRCPGPDFDLPSMAMGVALADPLAESAGHDLARTLKPPVLIRDIFPWTEFLLQGALVASVSLLLSGTAADFDARLRATRAELSNFAWVENQDQAKLEAEKKTLEERLKNIEAFQETRIDWATQLQTIAATAPETTIVTAITGDGQIALGGKAKTQLIVGFATPMPGDGTMPIEFHSFLASLRNSPVLRRHFPLIEISGLRASPPPTGETHRVALYSVVCLPRPGLSR